MKKLILFYDKFKTIPTTKPFDSDIEANAFIQKKLAAGITCYEYDFNTKYSVEPSIKKSTNY